MTLLIIFFLFCFVVALIIVTINFIAIFARGRKSFGKAASVFGEASIIFLLPLVYFLTEGTYDTSCCSPTDFAQEHLATIITLVALVNLAYFYSAFRKRIFSPVIEATANSLLLAGFIFNIFFMIQSAESRWFVLLVELALMTQIIENLHFFRKYSSQEARQYTPFIEQLFWEIQNLDPPKKLPFLLLLIIPIQAVSMIALLLIGQRPDSMIMAFTETYKQGFSQLDYLCDNAFCGGHFLCSVAAQGHKQIVKPIRRGRRAGGNIICNRQLLIANAFEELLEQNIPWTHRIIRRNYNRVGGLVHRHYYLFKIKWISDLVYLMMKPLEWLFLLTLYTLDQNPENRIAKQYLSAKDRKAIEKETSHTKHQ